MAIKAGQILHAMNQFIVDRIQTGGAGTLNIPQDRVYELGNFQSVGIVRDVPDLSFSLDCLDVGTQVEALLCGATNPDNETDHPTGDGTVPGAAYELALNTPVDIISPFKKLQGDYTIVRGVAVPQLVLESAAYKYGLQQNAGETFTLRGDSIYYVPGTPFQIDYKGDATTTAFTFTANIGGTSTALHALEYIEAGVGLYALNVSVDGVRCFVGTDYTETNAGITFMVAPVTGADIRIVFGAVNTAAGAALSVDYTQTVSADLSVKPAAIRGRDIKVYVGGQDITNLWHDVQSVDLNWSVNIEADWEFGDSHAVTRDFVDPPALTGTIEIKSVTFEALFAKMYQITGVDPTQVIGPQSSTTVPVVIHLLNPDTGGTTSLAKGAVLKTLFCPDARFVIPGYSGQVSQKMMSQLQFTSDTGQFIVVKGLATNAQLGL